MKNPSKINAKSTLEKVMQKGGKMIPKWSQNGGQNRSKIGKVMEKRHAENDAEIWIRKKKNARLN